MNECTQCFGSGKSIAVGSNLPYTEFTCSKCNGTGQDTIPPNETNKIIQMNPLELNEYLQNQPLIFCDTSFENNFERINKIYSNRKILQK